MSKKTTKNFSLALAVMMFFSLLPGNLIFADANNENIALLAAGSSAEMEGTSKEVLDSLRLSSTPVDIGEDGANPYSENKNTTINMFPRMELMMRDNVNDDIYSGSLRRNRTRVYDYDTKSGQIWNRMTTSITTPNLCNASASVGIDIDSDGRKNHVARMSVYNNGSSVSFRMLIEDDKGNELNSIDIGGATGIYGEGFNQLAQLAITAGDFDGDGSDEVAVCTNYQTRTIRIYNIGADGTIPATGYQTIVQSDYAVSSESEQKAYNRPQVQLTSGDLTNDNRDELIITSGYRSALNSTQKITPRTTIWSMPKGSSSLTKQAQFDHVWEYKKYNADDTTGKAQRGAYGSTAVGDIDGDGANELVLASYDLNSDSYDNNTALYQQEALMGIVEYSDGEYSMGAGGVGQSVKTHPNLASGMWDSDAQQPIALACFNPKGTGEKDLIFVAGMVYEFKANSEDASYKGVGTSSGHPAQNYGYKLILQSDDIWARDDKCYYGDSNDETDNIWIGTVAVGNFENNPNGGEQLVFEHGRKRDDKTEYRHDLVILHPGSDGNLISDNICINNDKSTLYKTNLDLTAIDNDNDGMKMRFKSKAAYFGSPSVVAVLQAAPYFADLEQIEPDYVEDGETVFGQTSGSGTSNTNGFSVTASVVSGFTQETSFLGIARLGGGEWTVEVSASMGGEWENASEVSYSTEYSSDSRDDRVVLSMTPYIRYVYDMYVPAYQVPTYSEYNAKCASLSGDELEEYKLEVKLAQDKGYTWGATVPATWTDYVVCMPKSPRMSMVEVSVYDKMAEANGFEIIKGNILKETVGNPATYLTSSSGLNEFDGGKDIVGENAGVDTGNFIWVSKGGGVVTQSIETTQSSSKSITWGAGLSTSIQTDIGGVIVGGSVGAEYTGSHTTSNYSSTSCSGTVAGIPNEAVDLGYDFKWRFGQWKSKVNNEECIVLGYLVQDVDAPPYSPLNLTVKDTTDSTVTLNWKHPSSMGTNYEVYLVTDNPSAPYYKLDTISNTSTEYVVEGLSPNTNYDFVMRSVNDTKASAFTVPVTGRTKYGPDSNVPKTEMLPDIYAVAGSDPKFTVEATPAQGGTALTYQWQQLETEGSVSTWTDISGETDKVLTLNDVDKSMDGTMYRCTTAQFVDGSVAYVYTNAAALYVGTGATQTTLTLDKEYGTASGAYPVPSIYNENVSRQVYININSNKYILSKDDTNGYLMTLDGTGAQYMYIPTAGGKAKIDAGVTANSESIALDAADVTALNGIYEFADESGASTGISVDAVFTDETGIITVGGEDLSYSKKYTDGTKTVYTVITTHTETDPHTGAVISTKTETTYYYTADTSAEPVIVSGTLVKYTDGTNDYTFTKAQPVSVTVTEQRTEYTTNTVAGTPLKMTADVESMSQGVVVTPKGSVEFTIANNETGIQTKQRVSLPNTSGTNTNNVSYTWTPSVSGNYTITARYIESTELMSSVSGEESYTVYAITSNNRTQTQKSLIFGCDDTILIGETLDLKPILQEITVTDDGEKVTGTTPTNTELEASKVSYLVTMQYGASAAGKYTFDNNIFKPTESGTYIVTVEYSYIEGSGEDAIEKKLSVSKTINVKSADEKVQQQIYFAYSALTKFATDTGITNPLTNPNAGATVEYSSNNEAVATVDKETGTVTPVGAGTATIKAVSKLAELADVSASYLLTIRKTPVTVTAPDITISYGMTATQALEKAKEAVPVISGGLSVSDITDKPISYSTSYKAGDNVGRYPLIIEEIESTKYEANTVNGNIVVEQKTLSADDFEVTANDKVYNKATDVKISAAVKDSSKVSGDNVTVDISGAFENADAGKSKTVNYEITSLGGTNFANYKIKDGKVTGTVKADITKAPVTVTVIPKTTYIYDGTPKNVTVNAYANDTVFTDFTVKYDRGILFAAVSEAKDAGDYDVDITVNDNAKNNYEIVGYDTKAKLVIVKGVQPPFTIEGIPDKVSYGDVVSLSAPNADGEITYEVVSGNAKISADNTLTFTGVGNVTVKATSSSENYEDKTVTKQINVQRRELIPTPSVTERAYDGTVNVDAAVSFDNIVSGDEDKITATAVGTMINADAGNNKIVYISGITLSGEKKDYYALSVQNVQSIVNILPLEIANFAVKAFDKTYDGSDSAQTEITEITGVLPQDVGKISILGNAVFTDANAGNDKTVCFTAQGLTGTALNNYTLSVNEATTTANILPMNVTFTTGAASFVYDGTQKSIDVSAFDNAGKVFDGYTVQYYNTDGEAISGLPVEAGTYAVKFILDDTQNFAATNSELTMTIRQASQEQISIVGLPGIIEYSDNFELEVIGGNGEGEIEWKSDNADIDVTADSENSEKAVVTINGAVGDAVTITAVKNADGNYTKKETKIVFVPSAKTVTFTLGDLLQMYDGNEKAITVTPSVSDADYIVTYNGMTAAPSDAGTYTVQVLAEGNYTGNAAANLVISKAEMNQLDISLDDWTYADTAKEPVYIEAPDGCEVKITYSTVDGKKPTNAGKYTVYATYTGVNYETYVASDDFEIKKRTLTVKANNASKSYGEANPVFTLSYNGFADGENEENLLSVPIASSVATADSPVKTGGYPIEASGGRADNYTFVYEKGVLDIVGASGGNFYITGANNTATVGDIFTLRAYYNNLMPQVEWKSSDEGIASITNTGKVMALKQGKVTISATITDSNYAPGISADFELEVNAVNVILTPGNLVLNYNGTTQGITLSSDKAEFVPIFDGEGKNVDVTYMLKTDPTVTEPRNVGEYTVVYRITDPSYAGSGTAQLNINKANVEIKANDIAKTYGEANPEYTFTGLLGEDTQNSDYIAKIREQFAFTSDADSAGIKANVGVYPITVSLKDGKTLNDDMNYNFTIAQQPGNFTINPKALTVKVNDAARAYGEKNADPTYTFEGFVNEETEENLTKKPVFTYLESITETTDVGTYPNVITASGAESGNYTISYTYTNGAEAAALTVTKAAVAASAGTAKSSYLTIKFDKAVPNLGKENFKVTIGEVASEITEVVPSSDNMSYTLKGSFKTGTTYSVAITLSGNYDLTGSPVSATPKSSGGSSGGGGGGGSTAPTTYTVTFDSQGASTVGSIKVEKNKTVTEPTTPTKDGYVFEGWFTDKACTQEYDFTSKVTKNITLYAKWTEDKKESVDPTEPTESKKWVNPFIDVNEDDWFYDAVKDMNEQGIFSGTTETTFAPNENITRAMMVTVLWRIENESVVDYLMTFDDIQIDEYYTEAVRWAASSGIVKGYSESDFAPNKLISREEIAAIMQRYAAFKEIDITGKSDLNKFTDSEDVSQWAKANVSWAVGYGLISGKENNRIDPLGNATRAEIAAILQRFLVKIK